MKRRKADSTPSPVVWRSGVHIAGTPIWCDALRTREACFVSSALIPEARRHRQIIATATTLELLPGAGALAAKRAPRALAVPYARPFSLGDVRLELYPSGAMPGAASLLVDSGGTRVAYAGTVERRGRLAGPAEERACDILVIDATYAHPRFDFPTAAEALAQIMAFVDGALADDATPVLLTSPLALGPDLLSAIAGKHPVRATQPLVDAARKLSLPIPHRMGPGVTGEVVIWPTSRRDAAVIAALPRPRLALVSGWARDPETVARLRVDAAFPLAEQAGHLDLIDYVLASGARSVYLLSGGGREAEIVRALGARGVRAQRLGPPEQLRLF